MAEFIDPERLDLCLAPLGFLDLSPATLIRVAAEAGFQSVGLRTRAAVPGGIEHPMRVGTEGIRAVRQCAQASGIAVLQIEQVGLGRKTDVNSFRPMFEAAAYLGASRVMCSGDDLNHDIVVERFASLCDLAAEHALVVDLEFMRFRDVQTIDEAVAVVSAANRRNGFVAIDVLHLFRSGGSAASLAAIDPRFIGIVQLCDAPSRSPAFEHLAIEARTDRLPLGTGGLPLRELLAALPSDVALAVEMPLAREIGRGSDQEKAAFIASSTRAYLTDLRMSLRGLGCRPAPNENRHG